MAFSRPLSSAAMSAQKFSVYLAGPIHGCNKVQIHKWREEIKKSFGKSMHLIDPTDPAQRRGTPYAIVKADLDAIEKADGMLVNMWRESIGSAIGIVHVHRAGRPVAIADPNHLSNANINFYASAVKSTPSEAAEALLRILRAEAGWIVEKSGGRSDEPFRREKLADALRAVCRRAKRNGIVVPVLVLPKVIESLAEDGMSSSNRVSSSQIDRAVKRVIGEFQKNSDYESEMRGILDCWNAAARSGKKPRAQPSATSAACIDIGSGKSHSTIWGKSVKELRDIPSENARKAFEIIWQVPGITRILLSQFRRGNRKKFGVTVDASNTPCIIEGKMFDPSGVKGDMQSFQVRVQHDGEKSKIAGNITEALKKKGISAGK